MENVTPTFQPPAERPPLTFASMDSDRDVTAAEVRDLFALVFTLQQRVAALERMHDDSKK